MAKITILCLMKNSPALESNREYDINYDWLFNPLLLLADKVLTTTGNTHSITTFYRASLIKNRNVFLVNGIFANIAHY